MNLEVILLILLFIMQICEETIDQLFDHHYFIIRLR